MLHKLVVAGKDGIDLFLSGAVGNVGKLSNKISKWFHGWLSPVKGGTVDGFDVVGYSHHFEVFKASPKVSFTLPIFHVFSLWKMTPPESPSVGASPCNYMHRHALLFGLWVIDSITTRIFGEVAAFRKMSETL
jgi:hypothetical protein